MGNDQAQAIQFDTENPNSVYKLENEASSNIFFRMTDYLNQGLAFIAGLALICMMLLVVFNSIKRLFSDPIAGTIEMVSWLGAITGVFALGYTQLNRGHVFIDLLVVKFPSVLQRAIHTVMNLLSILFFLMASWQIVMYGLSLRNSGVVSETIQFAFYPLVILCSVGFFSLVLAILKETILIWKETS